MAEPEDRVVASDPVAGPPDDQLTQEDLLDKLRRERADFLNYKRRVARERSSDAERVRADVVEQLLPVLDELERAFAQSPPELEPHPWVAGVRLIQRTLLETLRDLGFERIGEEGEPFDPERHEALFYQEQAGAQEPRVSSVVRAGYRTRDNLLRPAQVVVVGPTAEERNVPPENAAQSGPTQRGRERSSSRAEGGRDQGRQTESPDASMGMGG
jgi:molecular chaperone GrpE (heat shock protein)